MGQIKKVRLYESVVDAIREMIAGSDFAPGDRFYSENELTRRLEVSRSSVREAVRILEATGLVTVKHGKGIFIADCVSQGLEAFSAWLKTNEQSILDMFEVRLIIEPKAAWNAARMADEEDVARMEDACAGFLRNARKGNTSKTIRYDMEFHRLLANSTKNKTLSSLMKAMTTSLPDGWISSLHTPGRIEKTITEHDRILRAIKRGDAGRALQEMKDHLENAIVDIKAEIAKRR